MAVAQVSNVLGCVNPIQKITEMAHRVGAVFAPVPQKFEAGTVNAAGAVGLAAAIRYLQEKGFDYIQKKELELTQRDMEGLCRTFISSVPKIRPTTRASFRLRYDVL